MAVAVTGANSATGRAVLRLAARSGGPAVIACVRSERAAAQLPDPGAGGRVARISFQDPDSLAAAFAGAQSVIHLPGVLIEGPGSSYEEANVASTRAAVAAALRCGVSKLVLVSAVGADPLSRNRYYASKGVAERCARESGLPCTVIRAPLVLGSGTEGSAALRRHSAARRVRLLGGGRQRVQPLDVDDLARAALRAAAPGVADGACLELAGPELLAYRDLVERAGRIAGADLQIGSLPVPVGALRALLALRRRIVGSGFSPDALDVILDETLVDPEPARRSLGLAATPLDTTLRSSLKGS